MTQNRSDRFYILAPDYKIAFMYADLNGLNPSKMHWISSRDKLMGLRDIEILYIIGDQHGRYDPVPRRKTIEEMWLMERLKKITVKEVWLDTRLPIDTEPD